MHKMDNFNIIYSFGEKSHVLFKADILCLNNRVAQIHCKHCVPCFHFYWINCTKLLV